MAGAVWLSPLMKGWLMACCEDVHRACMPRFYSHDFDFVWRLLKSSIFTAAAQNLPQNARIPPSAHLPHTPQNAHPPTQPLGLPVSQTQTKNFTHLYDPEEAEACQLWECYPQPRNNLSGQGTPRHGLQHLEDGAATDPCVDAHPESGAWWSRVQGHKRECGCLGFAAACAAGPAVHVRPRSGTLRTQS